MTTEHERVWLLRIARDAVAAHVSGVSQPSAVRGPQSTADDETTPDERRSGVFVSLHHRGELRGCIGHIEADDALPRMVARCAVAACSDDPRFPPVAFTELPEIRIEMSLLGPLEPIAGPADVDVGRHGLVVEMGRQRGLLLPQVATEWRWDAVTFLSQTCRKAGLPADAWQQGAMVKLWRFEAEVFAETAGWQTSN
jgi:AmmeMemoRadiSam system protein A